MYIHVCSPPDSDLITSYTMGCPPVREDNPRALASGLSYVQVDKHDITILPPSSVYTMHSTGYFVLTLVRVVLWLKEK